jgi:hypothetical protein
MSLCQGEEDGSHRDESTKNNQDRISLIVCEAKI